MLTLKPHKQNKVVCHIRKGKSKKLIPVYYHPVVNESLRNSVDTLDYFFKDGNFRDKFELNVPESTEIQCCLERGDVSEKYQKKYFRCKRHVNDSLLSTMDLMDVDDSSFELNYPPDGKSYAFCELYNAGTSAGKTYTYSRKILRNLNGKKVDRRKFIIFSPEWSSDATLAPLRDDKYRENLVGVDTSDSAFAESDYNTPIDFFNGEIKQRAEHCEPGTVLFFDDACDMCNGIQDLVRNLIIKLMRVGRHKCTAVTYCLHRLRHGSWSTQGTSSCKYITVYPRSNKHKIRDYLNKELGLPLNMARDVVQKFSQSGRAMAIHLHCPQMLISDNLIQLL